MNKTSDALRQLINENPHLQFGVLHDLFNLSELSRFLKPLVDARTKKQSAPAALTVALGRLEKELRASVIQPQSVDFELEHIAVIAEISAVTFHNSKEVQKVVHSAYNRAQTKNVFMTISHGVREICILGNAVEMERIVAQVADKPIIHRKKLAALSLVFKQNYLEVPGLFFLIFQLLYFQGISVIETSSTANELILFVADEQVRLAFDSLYQAMVPKRH